MLSEQTISVIGSGAVGGAIIDLFEVNKLNIISSWSSGSGTIIRGGDPRDTVPRSYPFHNHETGNLIFIAVPDDQISVVANLLADSTVDWNGRSVVHCSGALFSDALHPVALKGARVASMHPIQTFKRGDGSERFRDIFISLEGDSSLVQDLHQVVSMAKAKPLTVDKMQKRALHLAAVMASNYLVTLQYIADEFLTNQGMGDGIKLVEPLVKQTLDNILTRGVRNSLSGPIERGDLETVKKHLMLLQDTPDLLHLYAHLGLKTSDLAEKGTREEAESSAQESIKEIFKQALKNS